MPTDLSLFKSIGSNVVFDELCEVQAPERISIGSDVHFYRGSYLSPCGEYIEIGSNTHFAPYCCLYGPLKVGNNCAVAAHSVFASVGHGYARTDIPMVDQKVLKKEIVLEGDVWVGANAVITQGVTVGHSSIVGAGAVVTRDVPPYSVVGGVPAKVIRDRREVESEILKSN
ncbi:MAG: acetyltransferase [Gemmatimonadetes bacterium]|nr:acetyltransferase [Gemmatimonadota bacterium]